MKFTPLTERLQTPHLTQEHLWVHVVTSNLFLLLVSVQSLVPFMKFFIPSLANFKLALDINFICSLGKMTLDLTFDFEHI